MLIPITKIFVRTRPCLSLLQAVFLTLLLSPAAEAYAPMKIDTADIVRHFKAVGVDWDDDETMNVGGVVLRTAGFRSTDSVNSLARKFTKASTVFDRVLTMPGHLVLSGLKGNLHWLALLSVSPSGTHGYVSALQTRSVSPIASPPWALQHSPALFSFSDVQNGQTFTQYVHRFPLTESALRTGVKRRLVQQGWKPQVEHDFDNRWQWRRSGEQLLIVTAPDKDGTVMFTSRTAQGKRQ